MSHHITARMRGRSKVAGSGGFLAWPNDRGVWGGPLRAPPKHLL